jgi:hypothetical protein
MDEDGWICLAEERPPYLCLLEWKLKDRDWSVLCEYQQLDSFTNRSNVFWRFTGIGKMQMESKRARGVDSRKSETGEELMVPYQQLSEPAKDLDRGSVRAVLLAIDSLKEN